MKRIPKPVFFIVAVLILLFACSAFLGVKYYEGDVQKTAIKGISDIRWGIDIRGGVEATFKPDVMKSDSDTEDAEDAEDADVSDITDEQLDSAKSIIETRMVSQGITDYELYSDNNSKRIIVRFPWKENDEDFDPVKAVDELAATAHLSFRNPDGEEVMNGSAVKSASARVSTESGKNEYMVLLELNDEGKQLFADITEQYLKQAISIYMDDTLLSAPTVQAHITDGSAQITGNFTAEEAQTLANQINPEGRFLQRYQPDTGSELADRDGLCGDHRIRADRDLYDHPLSRSRSDRRYRACGSDGAFHRCDHPLLRRVQLVHHDPARYRRSDPFGRYGC